MILLLLTLSLRLLIIFFVFLFLYIIITQLIYFKLKFQNLSIYKKANIRTISFVHPFCSDCGGKEKVLWRMITSLISYNQNNQYQNFQKLKINIISGRKDDIQNLLQKLKIRFGIDLNKKQNNNKNFVIEVELISMESGYMLKSQNFFTKIFGIFGQIMFACEIITKVYSDIYCDTTGLPFTYFILKYLGHAKITAYIHYPFISNEMIFKASNINQRRKNKLINNIEFYYDKIILKLYKIIGNRCLSFTYTNSTWTLNKMKNIWDALYKKEKLLILYPPCSTLLYRDSANNEYRENIIVSFGQFHPENNQDIQIKILSQLKEKLSIYSPNFDDLEFHIIGFLRTNEDQQYLDYLIEYSKRLGVEKNVKFLVNKTIEEIKEEFSKAKIGINTMKENHFSISLIEMMAAGLIVIAHNSGGAKDDLLKDDGVIKPGFLVKNENEYIAQIEEILVRYNDIKGPLVNYSTQRAEKFSDETFSKQFLDNLNYFLFNI